MADRTDTAQRDARRVAEDTSQTLALHALTNAAQMAGLDVTETATVDALRALSTPQGMSILMFFVSKGRHDHTATQEA